MLNQGESGTIKAAISFLGQAKTGTSTVLLLDEVYVKKCNLITIDGEENFFKGVMTFLINSLKNFIPFVKKVVTEAKYLECAIIPN